MKKWAKDYFSFSRKDRIAILILVLLIVITLIVPPLFNHQPKISPITADTSFNAAVQQLEEKTDTVRRYYRKQEHHRNYSYQQSPKEYKYESYQKAPKKEIPIININEADTTLFIALPGIGSKLASRIIAFREKLGGFYKVEQIGEVYGLQDSVFQKIKSKLRCNGDAVKKIDINTATLDELKSHPYIRYAIAKTIVAYREQHGAFANKEDLKKVATVTDEVYDKIYRYLE